MSTLKLTKQQKSIIHNCLLDLRDSSSLKNPSFLPLALDNLLNSEGFGIEMSGIYISTDEDPENIPDYLKDGISFAFMDDHLSLSFEAGIECIIDWCEKNTNDGEKELRQKLTILKEKYLFKNWHTILVSNGKPWKVIDMGKTIGANDGKETRFMRVELSANTIHGHPISEDAFKKLTKAKKN